MIRPALTLEWIDPLFFSLFDHERFAARIKRSSAIVIVSFAIPLFVCLCEAVSLAILFTKKGGGYMSSTLYGWLLLFLIRLSSNLFKSSIASVILDLSGHSHNFSERVILTNFAQFAKAFALPFAILSTLLPSGGVLLFVLSYISLTIYSFILQVRTSERIHNVDFGNALTVAIVSSVAVWCFTAAILILPFLFTVSFFIM